MNLTEYLDQNPKQYLIFDFDHTIVDLILPWSILTKKLKMIDKNVDKNFTQRIKKINEISMVFNSIVKRYGMPSWIIASKLWMDFERKTLRGYNPHPEIINFIKSNKDKYIFYIWTSNTYTTVNQILEELEIKDAFKKIITREDVKYIKPNKEGFSHIYKDSENPSDYLMIGDSRLNDGQAAKKAGIDFFQI